MAISKSQLVSEMALRSGLTKVDSEKSLNSFIESINSFLEQGNEVRLVGFGSFVVAIQAARESRNPQTGEKMMVPEKKVPRFRPGKELKESVNKMTNFETLDVGNELDKELKKE